MRAGRCALVLLGLLTASGVAPSSVAAQDEMAPPAVFADSTGVMWGVGAFEAWLLGLGLTVAADNDVCIDALACATLVALAASVAAVSAGAVAQRQDAPPDVPFVAHHALWGGVGGLALGIGIAGGDDDVTGLLGLSGLLVGAGGAASYAAVRRDHLLRDPDGSAAASLMTWGVPSAMIVAAILGAALDLEETTGLLVGLVAVAGYGLAIGMSESAR